MQWDSDIKPGSCFLIIHVCRYDIALAQKERDRPVYKAQVQEDHTCHVIILIRSQELKCMSFYFEKRKRKMPFPNVGFEVRVEQNAV